MFAETLLHEERLARKSDQYDADRIIRQQAEEIGILNSRLLAMQSQLEQANAKVRDFAEVEWSLDDMKDAVCDRLKFVQSRKGVELDSLSVTVPSGPYDYLPRSFLVTRELRNGVTAAVRMTISSEVRYEAEFLASGVEE